MQGKRNEDMRDEPLLPFHVVVMPLLAAKRVTIIDGERANGHSCDSTYRLIGR